MNVSASEPTAATTRLVRPELCLIDGMMQRNQAVRIDARGIIVEIGALAAQPGEEVIELPGTALVPGLANAHSHAFQRALRGRTQRRSPAGQDDFWSWRETMYGVALRIEAQGVREVAAMALLDMLRSGFTAVGEFHYLHHRPDGTSYDDPNQLALEIAAAAEEVGIRLVLLRVAYARGGFEQPATPRQRRFIEPDVERFIARTEALEAAFAARDPQGTRFRVGIAPHSVRAVDLAWLSRLAAWRGERVCHMHLSEQTGEVEACRAAHGTTPLRLVAEHTDLVDGRFTAVHGTWFDEGEVALIAQRGARVCACPVTERDLGDGFLPASALFEAGAGVCIGTDSHCQIDAFEELRLIEYHERLRRRQRVVLATAEAPEPARWLLEQVGARQGYAALGLGGVGGALSAGLAFDAVGVDLSHRALLGCADDEVLSALVFAGDPSLVREVFVGGRRVLEGGRHAHEEAIERAYARRLQALRS